MYWEAYQFFKQFSLNHFFGIFIGQSFVFKNLEKLRLNKSTIEHCYMIKSRKTYNQTQKRF